METTSAKENAVSRFQRSSQILMSAYQTGDLQSKTPCHCAASHIIKELAPEFEEDWWFYFMGYAHGDLNQEDLENVERLEALTGYSMDEISRIEGAFEGSIFKAGTSRLLAAEVRGESIYRKLIRTMDVLMELDQEKEKEEEAARKIQYAFDKQYT